MRLSVFLEDILKDTEYYFVLQQQKTQKTRSPQDFFNTTLSHYLIYTKC